MTEGVTVDSPVSTKGWVLRDERGYVVPFKQSEILSSHLQLANELEMELSLPRYVQPLIDYQLEY